MEVSQKQKNDQVIFNLVVLSIDKNWKYFLVRIPIGYEIYPPGRFGGMCARRKNPVEPG
jgi:hypothetical protein